MSETFPNADRPADEDLLERGALVEQLAQWTLNAPMADGFVIGVTGPWGSGKTTVLRLLETRIGDEVTVIWFEPWLFSNADDLVIRFFDEVASRLEGERSGKFKKVAERMTSFGEALSPAVSLVLGSAGELLAAPKRLADLKQPSAAARRDDLREALRESGTRIVVLIDDIDRLEAREIREVLRLVKLVADLPGVVHVLGYERTRVERAVSELNGPRHEGRAYLQKIIQAWVTVPTVPLERLREWSMRWLADAIGPQVRDGLDPAAWSDVLFGGIDGYLRTMRDGRQLANMAPLTVELCAGEVSAIDVIALETIRVFDPDLHDKLPDLLDALVGSDNILEAALNAEELDTRNRDRLTAAIERSEKPGPAEHLLRALFPAVDQLLGSARHGRRSGSREAKRVASRPVFLRYIHLVLSPDEVPSSVVDEAVAALSDGRLLQSLVDGVDDDRLSDLLGRVIARAKEQPRPDVFGSSIVLMGLIPRMKRGSGFLDVGPDSRIRWLVEDLVESAASEAERTEAACKLVREAPTLSLRLDMLYAFSKGPGAPRQPNVDLFDAATYSRLSQQLAAEVQASDAEVLAAENGVLWLLQLTHEALGPAAVLEKCKEPAVLRAVLQTTGTAVRPLADHGVGLHLEPLLAIAGTDVLDVLAALAEHDTALQPDVGAALQKELSKLRTSEPPGAPPVAG